MRAVGEQNRVHVLSGRLCDKYIDCVINIEGQVSYGAAHNYSETMLLNPSAAAGVNRIR